MLVSNIRWLFTASYLVSIFHIWAADIWLAIASHQPYVIYTRIC